jgi:hypothetical protein
LYGFNLIYLLGGLEIAIIEWRKSALKGAGMDWAKINANPNLTNEAA